MWQNVQAPGNEQAPLFQETHILLTVSGCITRLGWVVAGWGDLFGATTACRLATEPGTAQIYQTIRNIGQGQDGFQGVTGGLRARPANQCPNQGCPAPHQDRHNSYQRACIYDFPRIIYVWLWLYTQGCNLKRIIAQSMFIVNKPPPFFFLALLTDLCCCNIVNGCYRYMGYLLALEATATSRGPAPFVPAILLKPTAWKITWSVTRTSALLSTN